MKTKTSQNSNVQQRLEKKSKSLLSRTDKKPLWRAKTKLIMLTRHVSIELKFRKFRTNPSNRSEVNKQFVVNFGFFGIREISITYKKRKRIGHPYVEAINLSMDRYA
ncbi:hypothetical protein H7U32_10430, partial [Bifidobacterium pullorum subsp. saeculare]